MTRWPQPFRQMRPRLPRFRRSYPGNVRRRKRTHDVPVGVPDPSIISRFAKRRWIRRHVTDRVPHSSPTCRSRMCLPRMRRPRHLDSKAEPAQQHQAATTLRHPVVRHLKHFVNKLVTRRTEPSPEFPINLSSSKSRDVLHHDRPWPQLLREPSQLEHQLIPRIISLVSSDKARETLTRRTAAEKVDLPSIDPPTNVMLVQSPDVVLQSSHVSMIRPIRLTCALVHLDRGHDVEPCTHHSERKSSSAGEQVYRRRLHTAPWSVTARRFWRFASSRKSRCNSSVLSRNLVQFRCVSRLCSLYLSNATS